MMKKGYVGAIGLVLAVAPTGASSMKITWTTENLLRPPPFSLQIIQIQSRDVQVNSEL